MKLISIDKSGQFESVLPHVKTLVIMRLKVKDLNERIKGKIRLLNKFIDLAMQRGNYFEEEDSFYAFSDRISNEILKILTIQN